MSERVVKPIYLKRDLKQDFKVATNVEELVDIQFSTSNMAGINAVMPAAKKYNPSSTSSSSSSGSESESDSEVETAPEKPAASLGLVEDATVAPVETAGTVPLEEAAGSVVPVEAIGIAAPEETKGATVPEETRGTISPQEAVADLCPQEDARVVSPQPGPSRYEDITFDPVRTSTPIEGMMDDLDEDVSFEGNLKEIKNEMRDGKMLMSQIDFEFIRDVRETLKDKSKKHITKLNERRNKISKRVAHLKKQRRHIDNMLSLLNMEKDEIDDAVHKFTYFAENFPC